MAFAESADGRSVSGGEVARHRSRRSVSARFTPRLLPCWKRWLAAIQSTNWATTDAISCYLIGPLLLHYPELRPEMREWARHRNMWVRRAAAAGLIASVRRGCAHGRRLRRGAPAPCRSERSDSQSVGWLLREAGKTDSARLERYLRATGTEIPRTTVRYAIERFPERTRRELLEATRSTLSPTTTARKTTARKRG
jgi:3-methyladenine DNA glycosylase AlkD